MTISGASLALNTLAIGSTSAIGNPSGLSTGTQDTSAASALTSSSSASPSASVDISRPGDLFRKLQKLKEQDPAKYKQVVSDLADKLKQATDSSSGDDQKFLTRLATDLQKAADGGDLPTPPKGGFGEPGGQPPANLASLLGGSDNSDDSDSDSSDTSTLNAATKNAIALYSQSNASVGGAHHHHHLPSAAVQQTLKSAIDEIDTALGGTASTGSTANTTAIAA